MAVITVYQRTERTMKTSLGHNKLLFVLHAGHSPVGPITPINYIALELAYCQPVLLYGVTLYSIRSKAWG